MAAGLPNTIERMRARTTETERGCWLWNGKIDSRGYGRSSLNNRSMLAHRAMYTLAVGPIPDGLDLDHLCFTPRCINPAHLEPVTRAENLARRSPNRRRRGPSELSGFCCRGHERTDETTYLWNGVRYCKPCMRINQRASRARRRES